MNPTPDKPSIDLDTAASRDRNVETSQPANPRPHRGESRGASLSGPIASVDCLDAAAEPAAGTASP